MMPLVDTLPCDVFSAANDPERDGNTMDPSVSVPSATGIRFAATDTADPQLDPLELLLST